jgi:hypothetical protein
MKVYPKVVEVVVKKKLFGQSSCIGTARTYWL